MTNFKFVLLLLGGFQLYSECHGATTTELDTKIMKHLGKQINGNLIISPFSARLILHTLYEGSLGNSRKQIEKALSLPESEARKLFFIAQLGGDLRSITAKVPENKKNVMEIATKVYVAQGVSTKPQFEKRIQIFNSSIESIDFRYPAKAASRINSWVDSVTHGALKELVTEEETKEDTVILLLNGIFFKGTWANQFSPSDTMPGQFHTDAKNSVPAEFMNQITPFAYADLDDLNAQAIMMPYEGGKFAMHVIVPRKNGTIDQLMERLTPKDIDLALEKLSNITYDYRSTVKLSFPKFKYDFTAGLTEIFEEAGVSDIFTNKANLTGIAEGQDLLVSNVLQKTGVDVNEIGTTAYAVTEVELVSKFGEEIVAMNVDRPFIFFIRDEGTKTVIFFGKVVNPSNAPLEPVAPMAPQQSGRPQAPVMSPTRPALSNVSPSLEVDNRFGGDEDTSLTADDHDAMSYFDTEILKHLTRDEGSCKNFVLSPRSLRVNLGLLYLGAGGRSASELEDGLRLPESDEAFQYLKTISNLPEARQGTKIRMANNIVVSSSLPIKESFRRLVQNNFNQTSVTSADFTNPASIARKINDWVEAATNGHIPKLVEEDSFSPDVKMALLSAIFFKGEWQKQFDPKITSSNCFYISQGNCVQTPFMITKGTFRYGTSKSLQSRIIELPYSDGEYSMVILLPYSRIGLSRLAGDLPVSHFFTILKNLYEVEVRVSIPKFTVDYKFDVAPFLKQQNVKEVFTDYANLTGMFDRGLSGKVSSVVHRAKIEVNERGTVAAAATGTFVVPLMSTQTVDFTADRPFVYFIKHSKTGILFEGAFCRPDGASEQAPPAPYYGGGEQSSSGNRRKPKPNSKDGNYQGGPYPPKYTPMTTSSPSRPIWS